MKTSLPPRKQPAAAAGIVLLRSGRSGLEVLLGRRSARTRFMPGVYVFPGGRLDRADHQASGFLEPEDPEERHPAPLDAATRRLLPALRRAALRETWEETGLLVARPQSPPTPEAVEPGSPRGGIWRAFAETRCTPAFDALQLLARAITPAGLPIRFHTRFFLCRTEAVSLQGGIAGDGELEDLDWRSVDRLQDLPMADVTHAVLAEAVARMKAPAAAPCLFLYRGQRIRRR